MVWWHNSYEVGLPIPVSLRRQALLCNNWGFCLCGQPVWFATSYGRLSVCWTMLTGYHFLYSDWQVDQASLVASGPVTAYCCSEEQTVPVLANKPRKQTNNLAEHQVISAVTQLFIKQMFIITNSAKITISWMVAVNNVNTKGVCRHTWSKVSQI